MASRKMDVEERLVGASTERFYELRIGNGLMTIPFWLVEAGVFGEAAQSLAQEVRRQGMPCEIIGYREFTRQYLEMPVSESSCVIVYGSHPLLHYIQKYCPDWTPGGWCHFDNLACSCYYPHFQPYLLNQPYAILPGVEALANCETLFARFEREGQVFARPNSVEKLFSGRCLSRSEWTTALAPTRYDPTTQILVAQPQPIKREWRLVIAEETVVAAGQYKAGGRVSVERGCPDRVVEFAQTMLRAVKWRPDSLFMADVCETRDGLFLLELNAFSCSGLYSCDVRAVVAAASRQAVREWQIKASVGIA